MINKSSNMRYEFKKKKIKNMRSCLNVGGKEKMKEKIVMKNLFIENIINSITKKGMLKMREININNYKNNSNRKKDRLINLLNVRKYKKKIPDLVRRKWREL